MGRSGSGKTSMRSIIFANYIARDTMRLGATIDVEHSHVRFLGNLVLNLWDCGGQEHFMQSYFESQKAHIFKNVQVLIYVFDIASATDEKDTEYFVSCLEAIHQNSQGANIFCLIHKIDLVAEDQREAVFRWARAARSFPQPTGLYVCVGSRGCPVVIMTVPLLRFVQAEAAAAGGPLGTVPARRGRKTDGWSRSGTLACHRSMDGWNRHRTLTGMFAAVASISCFMTSIWDATLYAAWSSIVHSLIPNVQLLKGQLECLRQICKADEVVLFERATFLVICSASAERKGVGDAGEGGGSSVAVGSELRFEKVSNIIKQFKLSCARAQVWPVLSLC